MMCLGVSLIGVVEAVVEELLSPSWGLRLDSVGFKVSISVESSMVVLAAVVVKMIFSTVSRTLSFVPAGPNDLMLSWCVPN